MRPRQAGIVFVFLLGTGLLPVAPQREATAACQIEKRELGEPFGLEGVVEVLEQGASGTIFSVQLCGYEVSDYGAGMELLDHVGSEIRATVRFSGDDHGTAFLDVIDFALSE